MLLGLVVLFKFPKNSFNHLPRQISSHERVSPEELPNTSRPKFPKALKITSYGTNLCLPTTIIIISSCLLADWLSLIHRIIIDHDQNLVSFALD